MIEIIKFKVCTECKVEQELSCFSKHKSTKDGLRHDCKGCCKKYRDMNKEYQKKYRIENKEKRAEYRKQYYKENKEKKAEYRKLNKEKIAKKKAEYNKTPKGRAINKNSVNRRRSKTKRGDVSTKELLELQQNAKTCYWCNISLKNIKVNIDHYVPLSRGGLHTISNLVVSCQKCNYSKRAKDPLEFANSVGRLL